MSWELGFRVTDSPASCAPKVWWGDHPSQEISALLMASGGTTGKFPGPVTCMRRVFK